MRTKNWPFDIGSWQAHQELSHWHRVGEMLTGAGQAKNGNGMDTPCLKGFAVKGSFKKRDWHCRVGHAGFLLCFQAGRFSNIFVC